MIERERVRRGWPWSSAEVEEAARLAYAHDWTRSEIVAFIDALRRSSGTAFAPSEAITRVLDTSSVARG